ncbi:uncharacterized protein BXIN_0068 [Babesia sp. Xinjiang]|uniref:uncharacterized protein n=1 Tax=Babesia sp. Xinjiang TaxID=462227 RepID=UPI000A26009A|nr:uncharacterized protein BXIN_0068 [Babesia sp. Xinjiang]ORM39670.1 hypothetical protein BXIN_0068 [Babesia sp. Xinjiang]
MDATDDVTDDLLSFPGFIRRNLLLMRELDVKFVSLLNDAKNRENDLLSTFSDSPPEAATVAEPKSEPSTAPVRRQGSDADKSSGPAKGRSKQKQSADPKAKSSAADNKRQCRGGGASASASNATTPSPPPDNDSVSSNAGSPIVNATTQQEIEAIQSLRMEAMYLMQEKLAINDQVACMLKHEYENLKVLFDNMYREMETTGQMTEKLRMSFTVNKAKPAKSIEAVLSTTEHEILGVSESSGAATRQESSESKTPATKTGDSHSNAASSLKDEPSDSVDSSKT